MHRCMIGFLRAALLLAAVSGAATARAETVTVATIRIMSNTALFTAMHRGYFKAEGIDLDVRWFEAAQENVLAVTSGAADVASGGLTAGFYNIAAKGGLRMIGSSTWEAPGFFNNGFVATTAAWDGGLRSVQNLVGRRVGINTMGATQHYALALVAQKYGFPIDRVTIVPLQNFPNLVAAFKGGQIDVMIAASNIAVQAQADGYGKILAWSGDETPWQIGAIFSRPQTLAARRPALEAFMRAMRHGAADFNAACNRRDAAGKGIMDAACLSSVQEVVAVTGLPEKAVRDGIAFVPPTLGIDVPDIYNQVAFWKSANLIPADTDAGKIIDTSWTTGHVPLKN